MQLTSFRVLWHAFAFLLLAQALTPSAQATILFAGGEDLDYVFTGAPTVNTTAGHFRAGYAREAIDVIPTNADPPTPRITIPAFANQSIIWIHAEAWPPSSTTNANQQAVGVFGSDGVRRLLIRGTGSSSQVKLSTRNTAGTITDLVTCTLGDFPVGGTLQKLDWFINYAVAGEVTLYENGINICDFSGDVTTNSVTAVNDADFAGTQTGGGFDWSEVIVSTTDTRSMNLMTCAPQANGTNMAWTGSFANVNPTTINDASVISTGSSAQIAEFTCPSLPSGTFSVPAVTQSIRAIKGASGPSTMDFVLRPASGSTDYNICAGTALTTAFANYYCITSLNPACSCGWSTTDVTTGFNQGLESRP